MCSRLRRAGELADMEEVSKNRAIRFLEMDLSNGVTSAWIAGPLVGQLYRAVRTLTDEESSTSDDLRRNATRARPKLCSPGNSAYSPHRGFRSLRPKIASEIGAFDGRHGTLRGARRDGCAPVAVPHDDVVTTTTHKTLRGPRGGLILSKAGARQGDRQISVPRHPGGHWNTSSRPRRCVSKAASHRLKFKHAESSTNAPGACDAGPRTVPQDRPGNETIT